MRDVKYEVELAERPEIGPETIVSLELSGRHLALVHQRLDVYLRRTDGDPRQWIDPERMAAELAYLMVEEALRGARSLGTYMVMLPMRSLSVLEMLLSADDPGSSRGRGPDFKAVLEQTHERISNVLGMARH